MKIHDFGAQRREEMWTGCDMGELVAIVVLS
jgi:hypothetical protein